MSGFESQYLAGLARKCAVVALLILSAGCTTSPKFRVAVDAIAVDSAERQYRYVLKPVVDGVDSADLHFLEYAEHIHAVLEAQGLTPVQSLQDANIEIEVNYGATRDQRIVSYPSLRSGLHRSYRYCGHRDASGRCRLWQTRRFPHGWNVLDRRHRDEVRVLSYYRMFFTLEALDTRGGSEGDVLWTTRARADSASPDLRTALPLLVAASSQYIGKDTGREVTVVLQLDEQGLPTSVE